VTSVPSPTLPVVLRRGSSRPLHVQLAGQVRELVTSGALPPGSRLPSNRALATETGVARSVVEQAYDQLLAEGWLVSRRGSGTFVADLHPGGSPASAPGEPAPARRPAPAARPLVRLGTGNPWVDRRQDAGWRRAWRDVAAAQPPRGYPDPAGLPELRTEVAAYVSRTRGMACGPDEVLVTSGTTHGLGLLLTSLSAPGERRTVAVEDPGYRAAVATATQSGWDVLDVPVDGEGLDVQHLAARPERVDAVYVTPAHQHPLGLTMTGARRLALLAEAHRRDALVVEDDYDSEFRYDVAPLPALAALDRSRVVYLGTASKTLMPGLRCGWLVGPAELVARLAQLRAARHDHPVWPVQRALVTMLREGHLDKLVRAARREYAARGARVTERLGRHAVLASPVAGMYATLLTPAGVATAVAEDARRAGFDVPLLAEHARTDGRTGLVVGFGGLTEAQLARVLDVLSASLRERGSGAGEPDGDLALG
jgi:GntR family transcriptional regulator/MocR family aminotransferase